MKMYQGFNLAQLEERKHMLDNRFEQHKAQNLKLDMSRGKPSKEQLDLSDGLFKSTTNFESEDGIDCRNYGVIDGLPELKRIFAQMLEVNQDEVIVGDSSSLNMMYDMIARAYNHGLMNSEPWSRLNRVKFLCPSPGYDRHFAICELFGMEMITVPMREDGPDMDMVEALASEDSAVKGIWCVPKYSNPTGVIYSDNVVRRLASMRTKANDFRIFWDNAYSVHHLYEENYLLNLLAECKKAGNEDRVFMFASTAKISYAGAGVAAMAASRENIRYTLAQIAIQTINPNKVNHLLHARFFKDLDGIKQHMKKHAAILRPKFETVTSILKENLGRLNIARWTTPRGGYFISLDVPEGCARKVVAKAKEAGVTLTKAGATFPYGEDPEDKNIRLAPSFPTKAELARAIEIVCTCIELVALEKLLKH